MMPGQFQIERQEQSEWCWAAVAASIDNYFNPKSPRTQCKIASLVIGQDCCDEADCNQLETLIDALKDIHYLSRTIVGTVSFEEIQKEINRRRPVCARIEWTGGGAHFVVISGYEVLPSGARHVYIDDPFNTPSIVDYDEFKTAYCGDGEWKDTYLVRQNLNNW